MGSGFKDFAAGDVLTANDVDGYLMRQTAMTFADASARDSALSGVLDEGMMAYLEGTNRLTFYDGSNWQDISVASSVGRWTTFTPSWTGITAGSGAVNTGQYSIVNKIMFLRTRYDLGTGGSVTATPTLTIPLSHTLVGPTVQWLPSMKAVCTDNGIASYPGHVVAVSNTTIQVFVANASGTYASMAATSGSVPFSWGAGDYLEMAGWVEIA